ncbi:MAG: prolyl oligopeptidase family serine peptidase [Gammaproteobacteria bacterium]|nr:prolyl oligopeptidase family serine peptidase [Gammaproteobacteria bacterium]
MSISTLAEDQDPYLWLEEVQSEAALAWSKEMNAHAYEQLAQSPTFNVINERIKAILDAQDRIPYVSKLGDFYYNFWQDANHQRGILRRTTLEEYRKATPTWEVVIDVDQLGESEGESWVYGGSSTLKPSFDRSLISLSRGGSDARVVREFDLSAKTFVKGGFDLAEAKSDVAWLNKDEILVASDFGEGTLTESGYPRIVKRWSRGESLKDAELLFEGKTTDVGIFGFSNQTRDFERAGVVRAIDFFNSDTHLLIDDQLMLIDKPTHAEVSFFRDWLLISPKKDWKLEDTTYPSGSLLAANLASYLAGSRDMHVLFAPTPSRSLAGFTETRNFVLMNVIENVRNQIEVAAYRDDAWHTEPLNADQGFQTISVRPVDESKTDEYFITRSDFLTPPTFGIGEIGGTEEALKQEPPVFDVEGLSITQHWATSNDGTQIPYFQVGPTEVQSPLPTLLYGYGGFEVSLLPAYQKLTGSEWLENGGVYVVANIRGGGEFGPQWHRAALKEKRHRAYNDFIAVAEDLLARKVTTSRLLGIMGGSNGGLLMGNMLTRRPDLFGAIVAAVPLFDMKRYHLLLAGASWMAEYGDPDVPEEWDFIKEFSPYQNLSKDVTYPPLFVTTSTADDRVHPGHARKLVARMREFEKDVTYYENLEGGHAGAADNAQRALMSALQYQFLWKHLTVDRDVPDQQ